VERSLSDSVFYGGGQPFHDDGTPLRPAEVIAAFYEQLLDALHDGVYFVDKRRRILYWNKGAEELSGYSASEVVGRYCFDNLLEHSDDTGCQLCLSGCPLEKTVADGQRREAEVYLRHKQGHRVEVSICVTPIHDALGNVVGAAETFTDISAKRKIERRVGELEGFAYLDAMTAIPNRRLTEMKVKQAIEEVREFGRGIGLLMIDVDHFKQVNDRYGHQVGDETLRAVSRSLSQSLRPGDVLGRWGGEEFVLVVRDVGLETLVRICDRCRVLIAGTAIPFGDELIHVTASFGATLLRGDDCETVAVQRADELMYQSKAAGRNRFTIG
jgi:diguanylate cyclase (GGDEF)-like protein/PAS domain S-box-containing protein